MALRKPPTPVERPRPKRAVTAATATVSLDKSGAWATWRFGNREWQIEAWRLYDIVGELRFLASWIGDSVSQARLYVTRIDETGEETGEVEDRSLAALASVPLGTGAQRDDNLRLLGIDLAVAGEAWIVGEGANTAKPGGWFVLSGGQIRREGGVISVRRPLQIGGEVLKLTDGQDMLIRAWRPHPNDIFQSDSPTRSAIPPLREIELLTKREFAELESRLVGAGVWFLPEGMDFPRSDGDPEGLDGFLAYLQRVAAENIRDQSRASAMVPITVTVPDQMMEHVDKFKPVTFWSDLSSNILEMKQAAIARVAASFEIPSELLAGLSDSNHWTAWAISEEGIKRIKPYLACIADTLTRGFLVPTLQREGIENAESYAYAFDVSPLAVRPNRLDEALQLRDRFLLSDQETVRSGAFRTEQMPTDDERIKMLLIQSVASNPQLLTDPGIQSSLGIGRQAIPIQGPPPEAPKTLPRAEEEAPADGPPSTEKKGMPDSAPPSAATVNRLTFSRMIAIACDMTVLRALELAGGRLATHQQRRMLGDIPRHEIHTRVGPFSTAQASMAVSGAWEHIPRLAKNLNIDELRLRDTLHKYCVDLIHRGVAHSDVLLASALNRVLT